MIESAEAIAEAPIFCLETRWWWISRIYLPPPWNIRSGFRGGSRRIATMLAVRGSRKKEGAALSQWHSRYRAELDELVSNPHCTQGDGSLGSLTSGSGALVADEALMGPGRWDGAELAQLAHHDVIRALSNQRSAIRAPPRPPRRAQSRHFSPWQLGLFRFPSPPTATGCSFIGFQIR